jgi:hypothetical protein
MSQAMLAEKTGSKAPPRLQAEVLIENDMSLGSYVTEGEDRLIIGSSNRADLVMPNSAISQIHAMLRLTGSDILLYDLGSEAGTFVGGKKIVERKLHPGDIFEICGHRVRVSLLEQLQESLAEREVFWKADCRLAPDRLEIMHYDQSIMRDEITLLRGGSLYFGQRNRELPLPGSKYGDCFLRRKDSGSSHVVTAMVPPGFMAEVYSGTNELVRVIEEERSTFTFQEREKVRFISSDQRREILILWQAQGVRVGRSSEDSESNVLRKTLGACFTVALFSLTVLSYLVPMKVAVVEEAVVPKSSYERLTLGSEPAPAPQSESPAKAESAPATEQAPQQKPTANAASISSTLSKMLSKKSAVTAESIQQAITTNGAQTVRSNIKNSNIKSQNISAGTAGGGSVNVTALSAGLSSGTGAKAGSLNGFANGKGASIGGAGGSGFGGKSFDMSLGTDEAEALGGLDKSLIAAVVQANIGQIKHCYERQLIVDPNIFGKVVMGWTINKEGAVSASSVKKSTMNNKPVENCITAKIKSWSFPKPKGGGQVLVSYPFLFKSLN